jgi:superfamily II DNA or RNA helicase
MNKHIPSFQSKTLQRSASTEEYVLYKAALEWNLIDPIVIEDRDDLKSESRWRDRVEPYHHQVTNLITFCRRLPVTLIADDVGLGKTISAGLIISELISRGRLSKILIVCPKILREQWKEELDIKFDIPSVIATGQELITAKPPGEVGVVITTYQSARLYLDKIEKSGFDMLILDEAHKLRNLYGVDPTPQVAQRFRKVLADRLFKYVLMLTATPIQNRLWDLYSLVDLLTVARGHENPFGSEGVFARKFIADSRTHARQLKVGMKDEFRSIVYGYMSRVRRGDANLHFPERVVQLHTVNPSTKELELIKIIAKPIQELGYLAQIVILQALVSSPEALVKLLNGMAKRKTVPESLAADVREVVSGISTTAKLQGLGTLVDKLQAEQPDTWRVVVFTRWRETQTAIQSFLGQRRISCGLINGDSASKNQETIAKFKKDQPEIHVIVSTEAGSEGVNLQAANVLVNYDLPWNPMIVEQRIGRIQRLASNFANVSIFNIILKGTFEEYIVGRLMEKLQMASHAIGDIEALLEASGIDEGEENGSSGFEEKIRQLVVASLTGKDVEKAAQKAEKSISDAKTELEHEEKNINSLLGGMDGNENGPRCPKLPDTIRSMDSRSFALAALKSLGARLASQPSGLYTSELDKRRELIRFDNNGVDSGTASILYAPGTASFDRLVTKIASKRLHQVKDTDQDPSAKTEKLARNWVDNFGGRIKKFRIDEVRRCFSGTALMRVRATVVHDSYERLLETPCLPSEHSSKVSLAGIEPVTDFIENPDFFGVLSQPLIEKAVSDRGISEFCRFYTERMTEEIKAAGDDLRKKKKLEDEFTPRLEIDLSGLEGIVHRILKVRVSYKLQLEKEYTNILNIVPSTGEIIDAPTMAKCEKTGRSVPNECLGKCEVSGLRVLQDLLVKSDISDRNALPEYTILCALTGKRILTDEAEKSAVTGRLVTANLLKTSEISGKRAEPQFFAKCEFSSIDALETELAISQVSGKRYRADEELRSVVSGKTGHKQEFIFCAETNQPLLLTESEKCEITGKIVIPGILEKCELTGKNVLPSELEKCAVTGKKALKRFFVSSSLSGARILEEVAVSSIAGKFCTPLEAKSCLWSGRKCHPDDLRICQLTGVTIYFEFTASDKESRLEPLVKLLDGVERKSDELDLWTSIANSASNAIGKKRCKVEAADLSPDKQHLALSLEVQSWMGFKVEQGGLLYSLNNKAIVGRFILGKRGTTGWVQNQ